MANKTKTFIKKTWVFLVSRGVEFWVIPVFGATLTGWLYWMSEILVVYQPFSTALVVILAFVALTGGLAMYGAYKNWMSSVAIRKRVERPATAINPLDVSFSGNRIVVADLIDPVRRKIENKTFTQCELVGPAMLLLAGCDIRSQGRIPLIVGSDVIALGDIPEGAQIQIQSMNVILAKDCTFVDCSFISLVLLLPDSSAKALGVEAGSNTLLNVLSDT